MKTLSLVPPPETLTADPSALSMPAHLNKKQKMTWLDLYESSDHSARVKDNRFTFEMAAVLMSKFRSGKPMNATETKELKRLLIALGLVNEDDAASKKKTNNASKYFAG